MSQLTFDVIHWLDFDSSLLTGVNQTFLTLRLTWTFWLTSWLTKDFSQLAWGLALRDLVWTIRIDLWRALLSSVGSARPMCWGSAADQGLTPGLGPLLLVTPPLSPCFLSHSSAVLSIKPKKYLKKKKKIDLVFNFFDCLCWRGPVEQQSLQTCDPNLNGDIQNHHLGFSLKLIGCSFWFFITLN